MITYYEVRPKFDLSVEQSDRFTELKTMTVGYFESQIFRDREDGTHYDPAGPFAVADASEADMLLAAVQNEWPDKEFEVVEQKSDSGTRFYPVMV
jgi:hypothetical protein